MENYDIAVVGGGAAGCMAAIRAGQLGGSVILFERNESLGKKIMLTSNGRCNLTNISPIQEFSKKYIPNGEFYRTAFHALSNTDLINVFKAKGLDFKVENRGRVLPVTNKASSVIKIMEEYIKENNVAVRYGRRVIAVEKIENHFIVTTDNYEKFMSLNVIIAAGGISYKTTGSTGDGFAIAKKFGHTITDLGPALVPLKTKESIVKAWQGISFDNVQITIYCGSKRSISDAGDIIFTHFGISGPLVLDISGEIASLLKNHKEVKISIDFAPCIKKNELETELMKKFKLNGESRIKSLIQEILPKKMVPLFLENINVQPLKHVSQIDKREREIIVSAVKNFPLTINGNCSMDEAMVTSGGVLMKEINPRTMESKIVSGLYFAGEVIDGYGVSGGYNLQQAFSTGYLSGESAICGKKN
jgi:predicted Rossmann fold flavoprotein